MRGYSYKPTYGDLESTEVDVVCKKCGKKVDQICETSMLARNDHKRCDCQKR